MQHGYQQRRNCLNIMETPNSYSTIVLPILRRVREMLLPHYGAVLSKKKTSVREHDFVTEHDVSVEKYLKDELARAYPDIPFVGEETGGARNMSRFWLVDPIDGTDHFIRGMPFCTAMIALIEDSAVVFSAIYDFVGDIMYRAEKGAGAFANEKPIRVNSRPLNGCRLTVDAHLDTTENVKRFLRLFKKCSIFDTGASGFAFSMIASGKLDGRLCFGGGGRDYDYAPGSLLVSEAGGIVANIGKRNYDYRDLNFIAANPRIFTSLTEGKDAIFPITE